MLSQQILTQKPFCRRRSKGDTPRINHPLSATSRSDAIYFCKRKLEALGFQVKLGGKTWPTPKRSSLQERTKSAQISTAMFADQKLKQSNLYSSGSGAARILPFDRLSIGLRKTQSRWWAIQNYSHSLCDSDQTGLITFHGPNGTGSWNSFMWSQFDAKCFFEQRKNYLHNEQPKGDDLVCEIPIEFPTLKTGTIEGKILGGKPKYYVAFRHSLLFWFQDAILFIEDIGEILTKWIEWMSTFEAKSVPFQNQRFYLWSVFRLASPVVVWLT